MTRLRAGGSGGRIPAETSDFFLLQIVLWSSSVLLNKQLDSIPGINRPEHELGHLPSSSIEVKDAWCVLLLPPRISSWRTDRQLNDDDGLGWSETCRE
jgi:hypothetical protein